MLDEIEGKKVKVYAVWFNMVAGDSEEKWPAKLLTDKRTVHYWDAGKVLGTWYGENITVKSKGHVEWDAYFLYDADSTWTDEGPSHQISWGRTIVQKRDQMKDDVVGAVAD